jgi:hypothetical protein
MLRNSFGRIYYPGYNRRAELCSVTLVNYEVTDPKLADGMKSTFYKFPFLYQGDLRYITEKILHQTRSGLGLLAKNPTMEFLVDEFYYKYGRWKRSKMFKQNHPATPLTHHTPTSRWP